jgi:archaellum component FlaC
MEEVNKILEQMAGLNAKIGIDSSKDEIQTIKTQIQTLELKIKTLNPEFYNIIKPYQNE